MGIIYLLIAILFGINALVLSIIMYKTYDKKLGIMYMIASIGLLTFEFGAIIYEIIKLLGD